ncbi:MAG: preprotein translocase subunit SecA [Phycisphaerales bacterium]
MSKQDIPLIGPILNLIIGSRNERFVKRYLQRVGAMGKLEAQTRKLTDTQLKAKLAEFRGRVDAGEKPEVVMIEAFAVAREGMDRSVGIRNVFSPLHAAAFDPARLSATGRATYEAVAAQVAACQPAAPEGEFLGCNDPQPGWMQVEIPPELYEEVRTLYPESRPPFRARPFDVQLIGGMVLCQGKISEMKTGEGKTIVAPLACYMAAIERLKVHVVTVNDYLVQRDRDWTFPYFHALGMTVGAIHPHHMQPEDVKRRMYRCDVVYGTTSEFGFDYLRDNMKRAADQQVQKKRQFAIVDEVDSILIDEARTPLIISGPAHDEKPRYDVADQLARHLVTKQKPWQEAHDKVEACEITIKGLEGDIRTARDKAQVPQMQKALAAARAELPRLVAEKARHTQYFETQLERKACYISHQGVAEAQRIAGIGSFYVGQNMDVPHLLEQALRAHVVYKRDRDYIVAPMENPNTGRTEPSIVIVDVSTGRPMVGRQWSDGLHQACEAKEGVPVKQENQTVATITIQNFFKMYPRLAGMTGTADTEAQEFHDIYRLDVVSIPTNKQVARKDFDDMVFLTAKDKWSFITDEIKAFHDVGRPVLVGTTSVENSEMLSQMLTRKHGIKHEVLNAKQHEREAHIVENAGQLGAVMIATNMAGRGTDIKLGPVTRQTLLDHWQRRSICPASVTPESTEEQLREGVYRKMAPAELDLPKHKAEVLAFADLEMQLLRHWANLHTWATPGAIERMNAEDLRKELDKHGRFMLHRLRWFTTLEEIGGLHVVGTERHESRRIDNQLRGRSGRQGDKGSSRFFICLEDDLMQLFAGDTTKRILGRLGMKEGDAIEHPILSKSVERAQRKVEERNFQVRKNILEYDEVMEHQRQKFYGLRQRVLEGRELRGLIFEYLRDAVRDAAAEYLDPAFGLRGVAEYARTQTGFAIEPKRLRGLDRTELDERVRSEAKDELRSMIALTLGEYLPPSEGDAPEVDFDVAGLNNWTKERFGIVFSDAELEAMRPDIRSALMDRLSEAGEAQIEAAGLDGIDTYLDKAHGPESLVKWCETKFEIDLSATQVMKTQQEGGLAAVEALIMNQAEKLYRTREIEYPVDFMMEMTMSLVRQSPQGAMENLANWANQRFNIGWTGETMRTKTPATVRTELIAASAKSLDEGRFDKAVAEALACADDAALEAHLRDRYKIDLPENMQRLSGEARDHAIRSKVESILRSELVFFERTLLLDVLDDAWKSHLHGVDQVRDTIGFRSMSQQDPRIEFKREGARLFNEMMQAVRDRVTDYVFKARLSPVVSQAPPIPPGPQARPQFGPGSAPPPPSGQSGPARGKSNGDPYYPVPGSTV